MTQPAQYDPDPARASAPPTPGELADHVAHVLVVEDQEPVRKYVARILVQAGFATHEAADGAEALELLKRETPQIELVVSDIVMPRVNGVELLQALSIRHPDVPVILMSAYAKEELTQMGVASPCGVLPKPFLPERLLQEVRRCMRKRA
jgi:CheY-like chemotaxis protein